MILLHRGRRWPRAPTSRAPCAAAVRPSGVAVLPMLTLLGGTVGGYIPFSGAHRLLDAGLRGPAAVPAVSAAAPRSAWR